jgi:hypothetical protein
MKRKLQCKRSEKLIMATPMKNYLAVGLEHGKQIKRQITQNKFKDSREKAPAIATAERTSHVQRRNS